MDFLAIDFETANYKRTSCCAIGLVLFRNGKVETTYYRLLRPYPFYMLPTHEAVHGISLDEVSSAMTFGEAWPEMSRLFGETPYLVAHNAPFDMGVLRNSCAMYGIECPDLFYECSLAVSRRVWPKNKRTSNKDDFEPCLSGHSLGVVSEYLGIELNHHEALSDANACGEIMLHAAKRLCVDSIMDLQVALKRPRRSLISVDISPDTPDPSAMSDKPRKSAGRKLMTAETEAKFESLRELVAGYGKVAVALSGGVDSAVLMAVAHEILGDSAVGLTACSKSLNVEDAKQARALAKAEKWHCEMVDFDEFAVPEFADNPVDRCYYCKKNLFCALITRAIDCGYSVIAEGSNADDADDFRPGLRALRELDVRSPLMETGLSKAQIRELARYYKLPNADRPSNSCPATRFPIGVPLTRDGLLRVVESEHAVRRHLPEVTQVRVRDHGDIARIELSPPLDLLKNAPLRKNIVDDLKALGYRYVALDLEGYHSGSMNPVTNDKENKNG